MPLNRTPPKTSPLPSHVFSTPIQHFASEPNLSGSIVQEHDGHDLTSSMKSPLTNILSHNFKRKRDEITKSEIVDIFKTLRDDQDEKFSAIMSSINEVKISISSMTQKYDEVVQRLEVVETDNKAKDQKILYLENKIETLERMNRITSIELRNIPSDTKESKEELRSVLLKTADVLNVNLSCAEIKDIYRIGKAKAIIADFTTVLKKEEFIRSFKNYNKDHLSDKLGTGNLSIVGPSKPIYISENLTQKNRRLFFRAREFAKNYDYAFCWQAFGKIAIRKSEDSPVIRIYNDADLDILFSGNEQVTSAALNP